MTARRWRIRKYPVTDYQRRALDSLTPPEDLTVSQWAERYRMLDSWSMYLITSYEKAEQAIGRKADKNRKLYNGMMKTYFYQFQGPKPPARKRAQGQTS